MFDLDGPNLDDPETAASPNTESTSEVHSEFDIDSIREDPTAELLRQHYKFGHIPFRRLQHMAHNGVLSQSASLNAPYQSAQLASTEKHTNVPSKIATSDPSIQRRKCVHLAIAYL